MPLEEVLGKELISSPSTREIISPQQERYEKIPLGKKARWEMLRYEVLPPIVFTITATACYMLYRYLINPNP